MALRSLHIPRRFSPEQIEELFARQRAGDPWGVQIHTALAVGACFCAGWPTTYVEWAALPVLVCWAVRMTGWHSVMEPLAYDRVLRVLLAWGAWVGLSVLWSAAHGPGAGHEWLIDTRTLRFLPLALVLWPVMDRRGWMVGALAAGIACGQLSQIVHLVGVETHAAWLPWHRDPQRISGWWDPVAGGTVLTAGLGLHLGAALMGRGAGRVVGMIGTGATLACIALTGTRGAWIGAGLLVVISAAIAAWRVRPRRKLIVPGATLAAVVIVGAGAAWLAAGPKIADRFRHGVEEVRSALSAGRYDTDTGERLAMWRWAEMEFWAHPIIGVGAGGYRAWAEGVTSGRIVAPGAADAGSTLPPMPHAQAHSWYMHTAATSGVVGLVLLLCLALMVVEAGLRGSSKPEISSGSSSALALSSVLISFHAGPALALIGLACAGLFDTVTVNSQPSYMFYTLIALCLPSRPREVA